MTVNRARSFGHVLVPSRPSEIPTANSDREQVVGKLHRWKQTLLTMPMSILAEIAREWNINVPARAKEFENRTDKTYFEVLVPKVLELASTHLTTGRVLDVGCGLGYLSRMIADRGYQVNGVDLSSESIAYARAHFRDINFDVAEVCDYLTQHEHEFNMCIANMVLHNTPMYDCVLTSIYASLRPNGVLLITIPDPVLWGIKRSIKDHVVAHYQEEREFKLPFQIRNGEKHPSLVTYFHRPLGNYIMALVRIGFRLQELTVLPGEWSDISVMVARKEPPL